MAGSSPLPITRPVPTTRQLCLGCDRPFLSWGPGNRICARCNARNQTFSRRETQRAAAGDDAPPSHRDAVA